MFKGHGQPEYLLTFISLCVVVFMASVSASSGKFSTSELFHDPYDTLIHANNDIFDAEESTVCCFKINLGKCNKKCGESIDHVHPLPFDAATVGQELLQVYVHLYQNTQSLHHSKSHSQFDLSTLQYIQCRYPLFKKSKQIICKFKTGSQPTSMQDYVNLQFHLHFHNMPVSDSFPEPDMSWEIKQARNVVKLNTLYSASPFSQWHKVDRVMLKLFKQGISVTLLGHSMAQF